MIEITDAIPLSTTYDKFRKVMDVLEVGQSFTVSADDKQTVRYCAWKFFHRKARETGSPITGKVFTVKVDPADPNNFRCWRAE